MDGFCILFIIHFSVLPRWGMWPRPMKSTQRWRNCCPKVTVCQHAVTQWTSEQFLLCLCVWEVCVSLCVCVRARACVWTHFLWSLEKERKVRGRKENFTAMSMRYQLVEEHVQSAAVVTLRLYYFDPIHATLIDWKMRLTGLDEWKDVKDIL